MNIVPQARTEDVVVQRIDDEVLVYDTRTHTAHCLSPRVADVWERCDGQISMAELAAELRLHEYEVARALIELEECDLLQATPARPGLSRRDVAVRFAQASVAALAAPLIVSVTVADATGNGSCLANGQTAAACTAGSQRTASDTQCCSTVCYNDMYGDLTCVSSNCKLGGTYCTASGQCCSGLCGNNSTCAY